MKRNLLANYYNSISYLHDRLTFLFISYLFVIFDKITYVLLTSFYFGMKDEDLQYVKKSIFIQVNFSEFLYLFVQILKDSTNLSAGECNCHFSLAITFNSRGGMFTWLIRQATIGIRTTSLRRIPLHPIERLIGYCLIQGRPSEHSTHPTSSIIIFYFCIFIFF